MTEPSVSPSLRSEPIRVDPSGSLWAVTSYFNPARWRRRLENYRHFRRHLGLPLLSVELGFDGCFDLGAGDAERLLRFQQGDVMWQKERLLNLGISALPEHVTHVAWIDCDIVFEREDWWRDALAVLEHCAAVQPFERVVHLGPEASRDFAPERMCDPSAVIFAREVAAADYLRRRGQRAACGGRLPGRQDDGHHDVVAKGVAWVARRALLQRVPLFDRAILGGGDSAVLAGFLGRGEQFVRDLPEGRRRNLGADYLRWAERAHQATQGRIGAIPGRAGHLWHGSIAQRGYDERHQILAEHAFDPVRDLRASASGPWLWADPGSALAHRVRAYFASRCEDGAALPSGVEVPLCAGSD